jgi:KDO2-lipid IV(A) lauroyltransferase
LFNLQPEKKDGMFLVRLLSRIPFPVLYLVSDFLFVVSYYVIGYRRKLVRKQLKNAFPEKSQSELSTIEKQFYKNLCDYAVEMLKLLTISKEELAKRMVFPNKEVLDQFADKNESTIVLASHQFNWEWLVAASAFTLKAPVDFVYQPVNSNFFDQLSLVSRTRFGNYPIKRDEVAREIIKRKHILRHIATVADQYPGYRHDKKYTTMFLNQETVFFLGTNQLATMTQYPCVYYKVKKLKRGYYEAIAEVMAMPPYDKEGFTVIENYARAVERVIKADPAGWLWSHNRWKKRHLKDKAKVSNGL